ncbi:unnamed protein product [Camellia sinensis]
MTLCNDVDIGSSESFLRAGELPTLIMQSTGHALHVFINGQLSGRWNSYNHFPCKLSNQLIRQTADAMVSTGLAALGYEYINLDDCWAELNRDSKWTLTCDKKMPGSLGYEEHDANTFASLVRLFQCT